MGMFLRRGPAETKAATVHVSISGTMNANYGYAQIDGIKYTAATEIDVEVDAPITVYVGAANGVGRNQCEVTLNGTKVSSAGDYTFSTAKDTSIAFSKGSLMGISYFTCAITTS